MKSILVTGANGNLGQVILEKLSQQGYNIYALIGSGGDISVQVKAKVRNIYQLDLLDEQATTLFINDITRQDPKLTTAILLVGGFVMGNLINTTSADIDQQIAVNFKTAYHVVRPLLDHLATTGEGRIILIGARPALNPTAGEPMVAYALSKGLLFHLAELINEHGRKKNITATVIVPSTIDTLANRKAMPEADTTKWIKPEAIAESIAFLLTDPGMTLREGVLKLYNQA